jgi:hypothetical protein
MADRVPREQYPWWVKFGLWGVPSRTGAWAFVGLSVLLAVGCVAYAVLANDPRLYVGLLFLLAALAYWLAIRWVDRHGSWDRGAA